MGAMTPLSQITARNWQLALDQPGDVVAETGASVSGAALAAMLCAAGAIVMLAVRRQRR